MNKEYMEALNWLLANETIYRGKTQLPISPSLRLSIQALQRLETIDNANFSEALKNLDIIESELWDSDFHYQKYPKQLDFIKQSLLKAQEQEKENARLKEILMNGFKDKNGVFHKQTYLAFVDDEWCICDLKTDEWFLVKEVFKDE